MFLDIILEEKVLVFCFLFLFCEIGLIMYINGYFFFDNEFWRGLWKDIKKVYCIEWNNFLLC